MYDNLTPLGPGWGDARSSVHRTRARLVLGFVRLVPGLGWALLGLLLVAVPQAPTAAQISPLLCFGQQLLWDQRGHDVNRIMMNELLVLINPNPATVAVRVNRVLPGTSSAAVDLELMFPLVLDWLPFEVLTLLTYPLSEAPKPRATPQRDGALILNWDIRLGPRTGVLLFYNFFYSHPDSIYANGQVRLPFATLSSSLHCTSSNLTVRYTVQNDSEALLRGVRVTVFLPSEVASEDPEANLTPLYVIRDLRTRNVTEVYHQTLGFDGLLEIARGVLFVTDKSEVEPYEIMEFEVDALISLTERSGVLAPYVGLQFQCLKAIGDMPFHFEVPRGYAVQWMGTQFYCNMGFPDASQVAFPPTTRSELPFLLVSAAAY